MKKKWLFLAVIISIITLTLFPLSFLNADPPVGTTLVVTKDATASSIGYITWSVEKSVDQASFDLAAGETATANFTVTVSPTYNENEVIVFGNINIENDGCEFAWGSSIIDRIEYEMGGTWHVLSTEGISGLFTIPAGDHLDLPYSISFIPVEGATAYRNTVVAGLNNYAIPTGGVGFHEYTYSVGFSVSGGTAHNPFADVSDSLIGYLGETWVGDPDTYTYTYIWTIGPYASPGEYTVDNTATVTGIELPTFDSDTISVSVHVDGTLKGYKLIDSGIPGKGLETAPGQQKPFNPKSQASEHAGKKK